MKGQPIRVLYVVSSLKRSGPINQLLNLVVNLPNDGFSPMILTLSPEGAPSMWQEFQDRGIRPETMALSRLRGLTAGRPTLLRTIRTHQPQILHTAGIRADGLGARCARYLPCISTLHTNLAHDYVMKYGALRGRLMAVLHWRNLCRFAGIAAVSAEIGELARQRGLSVTVIPNGVDTRRYSPAAAEQKRDARRKLNIPVDHQAFVAVGALIALKDPLTVIRAFRKARNGRPWSLVLLGEGALRPVCEREAGADSHIHFAGQVANVVDYLHLADYFISASTAEGTPYAVLEGLACGLPVCLSDIPAHRALLPPANGAGFLFPVGDDDSLADRLLHLTREDLHCLRKCALESIQHEFSAEVMSQRYQKLYASILGSLN